MSLRTRTRLRAAACAAVLTTGALVAAAPPAGAQAVTTGATAYSAPAATGTAGLSAALTLTGALGGLLNSLITPIVNAALDPLVAALQSTVNTTVAATLGSSSSYTAGTPSQQTGPAPAAFPTDLPAGLPNPCGPSASQPCYQGVNVGVAAQPIAQVGVSGISGYTQQVVNGSDPTNPIFGRTQVLSPSVSVLPAITSLVSPLVSAGTIDARATCPNDGTSAPTAAVSATNVRLLNGLITLSVLNGQIANLVVNSVSYGTVSALAKLTVTNLPVINIANIVVQPFGNAIKVTVPLTLAQILTGLGLDSSVTTELLNDAVAGTGLSLNLVIGPNTQVTSTTAKAWGLGVGVDLSGALNFSLLGLVGASVSLPTGISGGNFGNVVDLRLGYATCSSGSGGGSSTPTPAVPPALV